MTTTSLRRRRGKPSEDPGAVPAPHPESASPPDNPFLSIGSRIRQARIQKGLLLRDVAERTGLTPGLISQVERGQARPSLASLITLADALSVPVGYFFESIDAGRKPSPVIREAERRVIRTGNGMEVALLAETLDGRLEFAEVRFEPKAETAARSISHDGVECLLVVEGALVAQVGFEEHQLVVGDSILIESTTPHRFRNPHNRLTRVIWVNLKSHLV